MYIASFVYLICEAFLGHKLLYCLEAKEELYMAVNAIATIIYIIFLIVCVYYNNKFIEDNKNDPYKNY